MYIKWLWIYLSHVIAWLEDGCVRYLQAKMKKIARTEKKFIVASSNRSQDSSNTASAGIAAPHIGSIGESRSELQSYNGWLARRQELLEHLQELLVSQETMLITALVKMVQKRSWLHAHSSLCA